MCLIQFDSSFEPQTIKTLFNEAKDLRANLEIIIILKFESTNRLYYVHLPLIFAHT